MHSLLYAINIGTLAAWLSVSGASTVALYIKKQDRLPELKTHQVEEIVVSEGELMDVEMQAGGSAPSVEVDAENNQETLQQQEAATPEAPEVAPDIPEMPQLAETEPLPDVPALPEAKPDPAPSPDSVSVPKPKPVAAKASHNRATQTTRGTDRPVARRTESGTGTGTGSSNSSGAGSGDTGAARFAGGRMPKPTYPGNARRQGVQGTVRVSITVDESGTVVSSSIVSATNPMLNDSSILSTVNRWKFRPGARATRIAPINFTLN
jgi:protein TonB